MRPLADELPGQRPTTIPPPPASITFQSEGLRTHVDRVDIGIQVGGDDIFWTPGDRLLMPYVAREGSMLLIGNNLKWAAPGVLTLRTARNEYNFAAADSLVAWAEAHGMKIKAHTLVWGEALPAWLPATLYGLSLGLATATMAIRPVADFLPGLKPLETLRKGMGVLSASAVIVFLISKLLLDAPGYLASVAMPAYWSLGGYALLAHLGDLSAIPLLVTSNKFSRRAMGPWWKRVQKLSYVYFYAGAGYEALAQKSDLAVLAIAAVTALTLGAWIHKTGRPRTAAPIAATAATA